ncbi:MAG: diguanylate cyclase [Candidatus Omnitrophica bacterium]|nr:diguanylate cyclase [Candidatus Omnitrophota bacterium]
MSVRGEKNFSVLLVENDLEVLSRLRQGFEKDKSSISCFDHALDLEDAFRKLIENSYDLLLVESELKGRSGLELLDQLNQNHLRLPFVLMTPVHDDQLVREAMRQGVADVIVRNGDDFEDLACQLKRSYEKFQKNLQQQTFPPKPKREKSPKLGIRDELTGLYSHSYLHERIVDEFSRAIRYQYPLSCIVIDIDHFKTFNEKSGYRIGDDVLKEFSRHLFDNCRLSDFVARYGGEEFAIILPHVDYQGAAQLASRLRIFFTEHIFEAGMEEVNLTISMGVSSFPEDSMQNRCELMTYANQALMRSKAGGRNRVTLYKDIIPVIVDGMPSLKISEEKIVDFQRRLSEISDTARRAYIDASKALIIVLESKDRFTAGHGASCAKYSMQVAEAMGMGLDDAEVVEHAALLHDVGKICIPDSVLLKQGKLTFVEYELMKQHPYLGYKMLKPIKFLQEEAVLVLHHHEWFNGEGYPCRLKGNEIPLGARIIQVIDSYDTIRIAGGRYKKTMTVEDAVNELINCSGTQFDPEVVKAFIGVLKERKELSSENYQKDRLEKIIEQTHLA